ncbi:MAG TPA: phosphohistidine phosphatase SixA [Myxococcales bacterium]|nr:phosphohistidine phosphatase SixA [Myxococcales bacterium]
MEIYLVRHGIAEDGGEGTRDGSRALTDKGRRRFRKAARAFGRLGRKLDLILTSPLVRAVQTAEILAGETRYGTVAVLEELDPKFDAEAVREAVAKRAEKNKTVALVGHEPQLSLVLAGLSGVPQADLDFKKGAIVRIDVESVAGGKPADARWWLKPRSGNRVRGLPLQKQAEKARAEAKASGRSKEKRPSKKAGGGKQTPVQDGTEARAEAGPSA